MIKKLTMCAEFLGGEWIDSLHIRYKNGSGWMVDGSIFNPHEEEG